MLRLPPGVDIELDAVETRYRRSVRGLLHRLKDLYHAIVDEFGDAGLELIRKVSVEYGREAGERVRAREGHMDLKRVGEFIIKLFSNMHPEGEVVEFSDDRVVIAITKCPYPMTRGDICAAHITMEEALISCLNPDLGFTLEKSVPDGDEVCLYVIHKKG